MTSILLVDDDVLTQWLMDEVLSEAGYTVTGVCRATAALELLRENASAFDLLVTDFDLPENMTGMDVAAEWRRTRPGRPVLYASGHTAEVVGNLPLSEILFSKPFGSQQLLNAVRELEAHCIDRHPGQNSGTQSENRRRKARDGAALAGSIARQ